MSARPEDIQMRPGLLRMPEGLGENAPGVSLPIGPFVTSLAARLDEAGIPWAVLRNAEGLPDFTRYDVDLLTLPEHLSACTEWIRKCAEESGWQLAGRIEKRGYTCLMLMKGSVESGLFFLPLDIFTALEYRGLRYLDVADVLASRVRTPSGIWTVSSGMDAAITLLKEFFPHGVLKENSRASVQAQAAADSDGFQAALFSAIGADMTACWIEKVQQGDWTLSPGESKALRREVRRRTPGATGAMLDAVRQAVMHLFRPSLGQVVCLAGADGSGKTTLARELCRQTFKRPFKSCRYIHGNVGVLPRFRDMRAAIRGGAAVSPEAVQEGTPLKGMMTPIPAWKSILLASYYAIDLCLAHLRLRRWRGQWSLVIMDRSFYDYFVQLGHRNCPKGYLRFLSALIPKPDLLLCLVGNADQIHARKPELTVEEIDREQVILRDMAERFSFGRLLDGGAGIEAMVAAGRREILNERVRKGGEMAAPASTQICFWKIGGRPVMAYAAGSVQDRIRALDLFPVSSLKRRWLARLIRWAILSRVDGVFASVQSSVGPLLSVADLASLLAKIETTSKAPQSEWLVTWPAQPERERVYLISRDASASAIGVVKIGAGDFNGRQLRNEAAMLRQLAGAPHPFTVPSVLFEQELSDGRWALALNRFPRRLKPVPVGQAEAVGQTVVAHLRQLPVPAPRLHLCDCEWLPAFRKQAPPCVAACEWLKNEETELDVGLAHGDLGPGNMLTDGKDGLFLFDWENASMQAPVWTDAVGLWIALHQRAILSDPRQMVTSLRSHWMAVPEDALSFALAFLCAHGNLAATRLLEGWK